VAETLRWRETWSIGGYLSLVSGTERGNQGGQARRTELRGELALGLGEKTSMRAVYDTTMYCHPTLTVSHGVDEPFGMVQGG
jgi:hypothetical protein